MPSVVKNKHTPSVFLAFWGTIQAGMEADVSRRREKLWEEVSDRDLLRVPTGTSKKSLHLPVLLSLQEQTASDLLWGKISQVLWGHKALIRSNSSQGFLHKLWLLPDHISLHSRKDGWISGVPTRCEICFLSNKVSTSVKQDSKWGTCHTVGWKLPLLGRSLWRQFQHKEEVSGRHISTLKPEISSHFCSYLSSAVELMKGAPY